MMKRKFDALTESEKKIIGEVWENKADFIRWPAEARLLLEGRIRDRYHEYPDEIKRELKQKGIARDSRSNGPAIMSFLLAGGERPRRTDSSKGWAIHHIYNGKFPFEEGGKTLHAVKDGNHFTQSAGLVAIHPIAHALADEYFYLVWLLRQESFLRFGYDPDRVLCKQINEYGFKISPPHAYPTKKARAKKVIRQRKESKDLIEQKLVGIGYRKSSRSLWNKGKRTVHVVRSSNFGKSLRIVWKEAWKDDHAIIYNYSGARGPVCIVPVQVLFAHDFVKEKQKSVAYANSGQWWSQTFPVNHELAKLVLSFKGRWDIP